MRKVLVYLAVRVHKISTTYTTRLKGNIQLELRYEGRKSGESRTIHKGGATMRALF